MFSAKILEQTTQQVTCIEHNKQAASDLAKIFQSRINVIDGDMHRVISLAGPHDAAVVYGVLYHSASPFLVLEEIVNYTKPEFILLEVWDLFTNFIGHHTEICNEPGYRYSELATCGIALDVPMNIWETAMTNLGYSEVDRFVIADLDEFKQIRLECPDTIFKEAGIYTVWKRKN